MKNPALFLLCLLLAVPMIGCGKENVVSCSECGASASVNSDSLCENCASYTSANSKKEADGHHYEGWGRDFEKGKTIAKEQNKSMLVLFTGSDWCPPCKSLHASVFTSEEFKAQVPDNLVLVVCDNPRNQDLVTPEEVAQYKKLSPQFKVSGVPSIYLTDADGKPYHKMVGYGGTPAGEWVSDLMGKVKDAGASK